MAMVFKDLSTVCPYQCVWEITDACVRVRRPSAGLMTT